MMNWKGAIFDLDGTLLDSMGIWRKIDVAFLGRRGFDVPDDYQRIITPMAARDIAIYTIERFGLSETPEQLQQEWMDMAGDAYANELDLKPYAGEYVRQLKDMGKKLAVATTSERSLVESALKRHGLLPLFDTIVTGAEVERGKGFPDIYLEAAKRLNLMPSQCVVYEDIIEGVRGAKAGGFATIGIEENGNSTDPAEIKLESDRYIHSFRELLDENGKPPV